MDFGEAADAEIKREFEVQSRQLKSLVDYIALIGPSPATLSALCKKAERGVSLDKEILVPELVSRVPNFEKTHAPF